MTVRLPCARRVRRPQHLALALVLALVLALGGLAALRTWPSHGSSSNSRAGREPIDGQADPLTDPLVHDLAGLLDGGAADTDTDPAPLLDVEVWGKAAIGEYLWKHVLGATVESRLSGLWFLGKHTERRVRLTYRTGYGVQPSKVPQHAENVVLVLNGHTPEKEVTARQWLDRLPKLSRLRNAGLVVLGREDCRNEWLAAYMHNPKFRIRFLFVVYGWPGWVDNQRVYRWPLGVATYRGFGPETATPDELAQPRPFLCNLQATIYPNSSREALLAVLRGPELKGQCSVKARAEWQAEETKQSLAAYRRTLLQSEYTLAPVGLNTECYRWYEASALGSTPVVEAVDQPATCPGAVTLLREEAAPFLFVPTWNGSLAALLTAHGARGAAGDTEQRQWRQRQRVAAWYTAFRRRMRRRFLNVVLHNFLSASATATATATADL